MNPILLFQKLCERGSDSWSAVYGKELMVLMCASVVVGFVAGISLGFTLGKCRWSRGVFYPPRKP